MPRRHGQFVWREVLSPDLEATRAFYRGVVGWEGRTSAGPDGSPYVVVEAGGVRVGGFMPHHPDMGPPMWMAYLSVEDVDAAAARAAEAGGTVLFGPMDAGQVGRLAVIRDPQGAVLSLWRMSGGDSDPPDGMPPGAFCWETLMTSDLEGALAFYERVVGWGRGEFDGGPVFLAGEVSVADVQEAPPGTPPHWMSHIVVEDFAAARDEAEARGAVTLVPELQVANVGRLAVIADPHGAVVSLFEPAPQE